MQQIISAKWTPDELALMDHLLPVTGAQSRSQLLRSALLALAEQQAAPPRLVTAACRSRLDHPYRRTVRGMRASVKDKMPSAPNPVKARKRR